MGELVLTNGRGDLTASGVGSCLVITLYDSTKRVGALAHAMLPHNLTAEGGRRRDARYVGDAIDEMLKQMCERGARRENIQAKIIGGANMFPSVESDIGQNNVESARNKLAEEGVELVAECVGGAIGRSVEFCALSGVVTVKTKL